MAEESLFRAAWRTNRVAPLCILALLVLNVLLYGFVTRVVIPGVDTLERRFINKQAQVREIRQEGDALETPQQVFAQGSEDLEKFWATIPSKSEFTALIGELFSLADKAGLDINQVSYTPAENAEQGVLTYGLQFSVAGDYGQIKKFVYLLEQSRRLIIIDELSLSSARGEGQEVSLRIRLTTYFKAREK